MLRCITWRRRGGAGRVGPGTAQGRGPLLPLRQILHGARVAPARIRVDQALPRHAGRHALALALLHIAAPACAGSIGTAVNTLAADRRLLRPTCSL